MARRRGFLAELQHQSRLAEQHQRAAMRQHQAAVRQTEQAQRAAERAHTAALRASEADRKRLERDAASAHVAAMEALAAQQNSELNGIYDEVDSLLAATLEVDDYVDLESLRVTAKHPPFPAEHLRSQLPVPSPIPDPPLPVQRQPEAPTGLFGKKKKLAEAEAAAAAQYAADYYAWQAATTEVPARRAAQEAQYASAESRRKQDLEAALATYQAECDIREQSAAEQNEVLDQLITGLAYGSVGAVEEYIGIVVANSIYPQHFSVEHDAAFEPSTAELKLRVVIPGPATVPTTKAFRYTKSTDEITSTPLTQKDQKDRYLGAVHNVALRSLHEVFEADRRGLIHTISLELGTETISPATGRETYVPFVVATVRREAFLELDLSAVTPSATLEHLGAVVSKNPFTLAPITTTGVRRA